MNIVIGQVAHETNTFSSIKTTTQLFQDWEWDEGSEIIDRHTGVEDYLGGMIKRALELGINTKPSFSAYTNPSGIITRDTYEGIKNKLIDSITEMDDYDGICLMLHGAGVAEQTEDIEGDLLQSLREEVGYEVPVVVVLDLHANISELMVHEADLIIGDNYYPHTDSFERGKEAIDLCVKMTKGEIQPTMAFERRPLMIPTSTTNVSPASDINEWCWSWEAHDNVLDCTFYHGFPYSDTSNTGVSVLTITDQNESFANDIAKQVADRVWNVKDKFDANHFSPREGIEHALKSFTSPVILNETSDNPGAGTPGDGTHLLKEMINMNLENACFGAIFDPEVAEEAHEHGPGQCISVELGAKTDQLHGTPIIGEFYVKNISDGRFKQTSPMWKGIQVDVGKSARLQLNGVDIIVCSVNNQIMDEQLFLLHGIVPSNYNIVALKSSQHFRAAFDSIASKIITVDSMGLSTFDLSVFEYKNILRPIAPLDKED
ncbi:M81 family metallopeptidase [Pontibacillus marinus]|uniref:Microcystin LR degradation protein MlrC n=1 Tax=Pontibacillus marinus BH030004 = DSM 16465 TaxID=1385511 RepID=A0A0A5I4M8_9BACI|nr:M81 family metallopeptidase [Pontibacillus marinus]KGX90782.1 Microcystin LR degradation protein MlrC [Pontibacillus marinus BH030004 = DSM 16465]